MSDVQERPEISLGQALRLIAERTSFRSEEEGRDVLAAIDKANNSDGSEHDDTDTDDDERDPADDTTPGNAGSQPADTQSNNAEVKTTPQTAQTKATTRSRR